MCWAKSGVLAVFLQGSDRLKLILQRLSLGCSGILRAASLEIDLLASLSDREDFHRRPKITDRRLEREVDQAPEGQASVPKCLQPS